jgi:hypothetical protein
MAVDAPWFDRAHSPSPADPGFFRVFPCQTDAS